MEEELSAVSKKEKLRLYLLLIGRDRHGEPCLNVNFDDGTVMLFKEVRNITLLLVVMRDPTHKGLIRSWLLSRLPFLVGDTGP